MKAANTLGAVLAGGHSRRMGRPKAMLELGGKTLLARAVSRLQELELREVVVAGGMEWQDHLPGIRFLPDDFPGAGPLGAIATLLRSNPGTGALVVACDMPFLNVGLLRHILQYAGEFDVVVPRLEDGTHQMHAYYGPGFLPVAERRLARGEYKIDRAFPEVRVRYLGPEAVDAFDPEHLSVQNINTPEDWDAVDTRYRFASAEHR